MPLPSLTARVAPLSINPTGGPSPILFRSTRYSFVDVIGSSTVEISALALDLLSEYVTSFRFHLLTYSFQEPRRHQKNIRQSVRRKLLDEEEDEAP
jgi:hypothetical protein